MYPEKGGWGVWCVWAGGITTVTATTSARFVAVAKGKTENETFGVSLFGFSKPVRTVIANHLTPRLLKEVPLTNF